jgi:hypothetical protein
MCSEVNAETLRTQSLAESGPIRFSAFLRVLCVSALNRSPIRLGLRSAESVHD